jgi:nucleotidyltransferase/DNA polymerase involved in DNA repair
MVSRAMNIRNIAANSARELGDLISVGAKTVSDFHSLGVYSIAQLAKSNPETLYKKLCRLHGQRIDPCCLDVFSAAVAQARNPLLPAEQCVWWYWSRQRKAKATAK